MRRIPAVSMLIFTISIGPLFIPAKTMAASEADIDKLTTYSVIIGRAVACGVDTENAMRSVGAWMDKTFSPGTSDQKNLLTNFY